MKNILKVKVLARLILILSITFFISCKKNDVSESDKLFGSWIPTNNTGSELKLKRSSSLIKNEYGIKFSEKNKVIERSSGRCGTPPITYHDSQGTWTRDDLIISIVIRGNYKKWEIKSLNNNYLIVKTLN